MQAFSFRVPQHMIYMLGQALHDLVVDEPRRVSTLHCALLPHAASSLATRPLYMRTPLCPAEVLTSSRCSAAGGDAGEAAVRCQAAVLRTIRRQSSRGAARGLQSMLQPGLSWLVLDICASCLCCQECNGVTSDACAHMHNDVVQVLMCALAGKAPSPEHPRHGGLGHMQGHVCHRKSLLMTMAYGCALRGPYSGKPLIRLEPIVSLQNYLCWHHPGPAARHGYPCLGHAPHITSSAAGVLPFQALLPCMCLPSVLA